jgi:hypothetical protein
MRVEFDALPRSVRERWVEAARDPGAFGGMAATVNQLREDFANRFYWLCLIAGPIGTFFASYSIDWDMAPAAVAVAAACAGACGLLLLSRPLKRRTWDEGYVFPGCIVFARGRQLEILPFEKMPPLATEVSVKRATSGYTLNKFARVDVSWWHQLILAGGTSDEAIMRYNLGRSRYARALETGDHAALASMHPLYECVYTGRWKAERAEPGGPRFGGLGTWPSRAVTFILVPAIAVAAVGVWHKRAVDARLARMAAYAESEKAWMKPIVGSAASPTAEAMLRAMCEQRGTSFAVFAPALSQDTLRVLDESARADKALGPSQVLKDDWDGDAFVKAVEPRFKAVFTGWDTSTREGAGVSFSTVQAQPQEGEIISVALEATRSGDAVTVSASGGGGGSIGGGTRIGGAPAMGQRGSGRCLPLAFRGVVTTGGVAKEPFRVAVEITAMSSDAIAQDVSRSVDAGNLNAAAHICYQVQIRHAFAEAGRAFLGAVFREGATPSVSSM